MSLRSLRAGVRRLLQRDAADRELTDEIAHYLELAVEEHMRRGLTRAEAERAARVEFGGVEAAKERVRSSGWESIIETLWQDIRYAARGLRRNPLFTLAATITLALGIGANAAMFSVINAVMLRPLPYEDSRRLLLLWTHDVRRGLPFEATAYATIADWQRTARTFEDIAFYRTGRHTLGEGATIERTRAAFISANLLPLLGIPPVKGRWITPQDERDPAPVALISHALWQRRFASDPDIIGKTLELDNWQGKNAVIALTVVGVMPADFYFPDRLTHVWIFGTAYRPGTREAAERFPSWARRWIGVGRLAPGTSVADARAELATIGRQLAATHPTADANFPGFAVNALPILDYVTGTAVQRSLWLLFGAVVLMLLVACANVGNLLLARGAARQQEMGLRRALGATRLRVVRQFVVESLVLASIGGALGLLFAVGVTRALAVAARNQLPRIDEISVDLSVLVFVAATSMVSGLVFGLVPAVRVTATDAIRIRRTRGLLVVAECSVAVLLLLGAGLMLRSLERVHAVEPGFDPSGVLLVRIEFPRQLPVLENLLARLEIMPDVVSAGFIDDLFIGGSGRQSVVFAGRSATEFEAGQLHEGTVTARFFSTMRVPLRRGRYLTADDAATKARPLGTPIRSDLSLTEKASRAIAEPVLVNEAFVRRFVSDRDPIGERFCKDATDKTYCYEIVGVVGDMLRQGPERRPIPQYFGPLLPAPAARADLAVRTRGAPEAAARTIDAVLRQAVPGVLVPSITIADAAFGEFTAQRNLQTWLLSVFAFLALVLAAVGIYGVVHYAVSQRTREIGIRIALGARRPELVRLLVTGGMRLPLIGIACGVVAAFGVTRVMSHLLFEVGATDVVTFAAGALTLAAVALAACYVPARRAARLDAVTALRLD